MEQGTDVGSLDRLREIMGVGAVGGWGGGVGPVPLGIGSSLVETGLFGGFDKTWESVPT